MKKNQEYFKKIVALGLAMSMLGVTAYAEDATEVTEDTAEQIEAEEVIEDEVLTFAEAYDLLLDNSIKMTEYEKQLEYLQEQKSDVWDSYGSFAMPSATYQQWVDASVYAYKNAIYTITTSTNSAKIGQELDELGYELTLMNSFSTLFSTYESLDVLEETLANTEISYAQTELKHSLGMVSDYSLEQEKISLESLETSVAQLELNVENQFVALNNLLGFSADERYVLENPFEFESYVIDDMENFITFALRSDLSVEMAEISLDSAEFSKNFLSVASTTSDTDRYNYNYETAKLDLKSTKTAKEESIRSAYITLQQTELNYNSALVDLTQAEKDYALAEVNFSIGNITQLVLNQSALAVIQAENTVASLERSYALQVFSLENTSIL